MIEPHEGEGRPTTVVKIYDVLPTSRFNIWADAMVPERANEEFGMLVEVLRSRAWSAPDARDLGQCE